MKQHFIRQSLELTQAQWDYLQELARATGSFAPAGTNAGNAAWRTLLKRIASGDLMVVAAPPKQPSKHKATV